jgi:3-methyladenine DNA glycosylase AlkC
MVPSDYVAVYGLEDWEISIPALEVFTQITSAEFAVRPFLDRYGVRMLDQMRAWADHDDAAVRRLASEGGRPRLPWAERVPALIDDPAPIVPILDVLVDDVDGAVRRSVANSLNDVSKDHRELAIAIARRWSLGAGDGRMRTIRHGLRTLIKQGDAEALTILGFGHDPDIVIEATRIEPSTFTIGDAGRFSFTVRSTSRRSQRLEVDYVVTYARRSGRPYEKVWKGRSVDLEPGDSAVITRTVTFANMSTRTIHPGVHLLTPQVNGVRFAATEVLVGEGSAP